MEDIPAPRPYRHGNLPNAMRAAARTLLDEAGPEGVGLREAARRVGVSATAAYRYFASKEDLLASVAAEGFRELAAALKAAADSGDPVSGIGPAYVDFALKKRGLFRLMFGPLLADREKYPALNEAVNEAFDFLQRAITGAEGKRQEESPANSRRLGPRPRPVDAVHRRARSGEPRPAHGRADFGPLERDQAGNDLYDPVAGSGGPQRGPPALWSARRAASRRSVDPTRFMLFDSRAPILPQPCWGRACPRAKTRGWRKAPDGVWSAAATLGRIARSSLRALVGPSPLSAPHPAP